MKRVWVITYLVWGGLALAAAAEAGRLGFGSFGRPGPGFLPFIAAVALGGLALVGLIRAAAGREEAQAKALFRGADLLRIGVVAGVLFLYVLGWEIFGFLPCTFVLLLFLFRCVEPLRWRTVFLGTLFTLAMTYILFSVLLGARLPAGRLWSSLLN